MRRTDQTLLEQMRLNEVEINHRKVLFSFSPKDTSALMAVKPYIEPRVGMIVDKFFAEQTADPEISLLIGDADTLHWMRTTQSTHILDLFSGHYDVDYVHNRLRLGLMHKRIGIDPKYYLAGIQALKTLLFEEIFSLLPDSAERDQVIISLDRLIMFDLSIIFDMYIHTFLSAIELSKERAIQHALMIEERVKSRTQQLEELSRTDPLTGLLNMRLLKETVNQTLRLALRDQLMVTVAYIDLNDFKIINDTRGHQSGDRALQALANALKQATRAEDYCFRYGGDEFCIVMSNCSIEEAKRTWAPRLLESLHAHDPTLRMSIGYAQTGPDEFVTAEELLHQADEQMYAVKRMMKAAIQCT